MGILLNLVLLIGGAGVFLSANGPGKVSAFIDDKLGNKEDTTPVPIDEGDGLPPVRGPDFPPGKETIPKKDDFTLETLPGTNVTVAIPKIPPVQGPVRPITPRPTTIAQLSTTPKTTEKVKTPSRNVQTGLSTRQQFQGGGKDFIGGTVRETKITKDSTLSFIINKLGVSASKAASIRTELRGGLKNFDTGTNTGSGQKGSSATASRESRKERLQREAENAKQIFDAGSITNF